ncbi:MAG: GGDEF domain-containing protein, partial [Burkholderiaceae bacterium]|nr:GGDEF domain-containing protein [Burkholderiaceae bacterium]
GRYGGEEFIAALPETSLDTATAFAERLRKAIEADSVHTEKGNIHYTLSIGVSTLLPTTETLFSAIETADEGLYEAKRKGKNKVVAKNRRSVQGTLL